MTTATAPARTVYVVASGDLRPSANVKCWPIQQQLEADVTRAVESFGWTVVRGHSYDEDAGHGFVNPYEQSKAEMQEKMHDLEKFEEVVVGRELKMIALEKEIESLRRQVLIGSGTAADDR